MLRIASPLLLGLLLLAGPGCAASAKDDGATSSESPLSGETSEVLFSTASWEPAWVGTPTESSNLVLHYDFDRLPACRNQGRIVSWVIEVGYRFDGGAITTKALPGSPGSVDVLDDSTIQIPYGAREIELWFQNRAVGGYDHCASWDSSFGANYRHAIRPL